ISTGTTVVCVWQQTGNDQNGMSITGRTTAACQNEDVNLNGLLNPGEDFNNNGRLDPGNVATVPTTVTTDASGFAFFNVVYAKEFAGWVEVELEARAVVTGSEGTSQVRFFLRPLAGDFSDCTVAPPGVCSPYGVAAACTWDEQACRKCPVTMSADVPPRG